MRCEICNEPLDKFTTVEPDGTSISVYKHQHKDYNEGNWTTYRQFGSHEPKIGKSGMFKEIYNILNNE
jgi:hypothetical protein